MAKGGSGDVLTGVLTGLLSQKYSALETAIIGVFTHGMAGDIARDKIGENSVLAGDIVENLGAVLQSLVCEFCRSVDEFSRQLCHFVDFWIEFQTFGLQIVSNGYQ